MPDVDPDQLLKELDAKLALMRSNRVKPSVSNQTVRLVMMVVFGGILIMVLWVLQLFLTQMLPARGKIQVSPKAQVSGIR
ncbi:MAG: hypothetical protein WCH43_04265 [Verrucomicrobiota bacterium]